MKKIGVLALQGAFIEHEKMLEKLGASCVELRNKEDLKQDLDGLVFPGGESTVQGKLLKERIENGTPVLGTCAGMILLASDIENQSQQYFGTIPMCVKRNAYGRQLGSFHTTDHVKEIGEVPMTFIRAPYVDHVGEGVKVLAEVEGKIVGVQYKKQLAFAFHPELDNDKAIHQKFLELI